jgi:hypothetical protein
MFAKRWVRSILLKVSLLAVLPCLLSSTVNREETVAFIRATFAESAQVERRWEATPENERKVSPTWYSALRPAMKQPTDIILEAIDRSLHGEVIDERSGALNAYDELVRAGKVKKDPEHFRLFIGFLERDDGKSAYYTNSLVSALMLYPSPETVSALMGFGSKARTAAERQNYLSLAAGLLAIDLPIYQQTKPLEREQILANFQAWYEQNKERISFDSEGRPSVKGANPNVKPRALTSQERALIRKDPACVVELLQGSSGGIEVSEERMKKLLERCGEALYGPEGLRLVKHTSDKSQAGDSEEFDLQMNSAAARTKYPMLDAALLAVAYVAADDPDPKHRELALLTLDDIGMPEDIVRVLKNETKDVRQKTMELADEKEKDEK